MWLPFLRRTPPPHTSQPPATKAPQQELPMAATATAPVAESMLAKVALECGGDISASQEEVLATSSFLGGDNDLAASASASQDDDEEAEEVFATPPDATQQDPITMCTLPFTPPDATQHQQEDPIAMCSLRFTPSQPQSPAPPSADDATNPRRKARVCTRKVRGARISTPTPSPEQQPEQLQLPEQQQPQPEQQLQAEQQPQPEEQLQAEQQHHQPQLQAEQQPQPEQPLHDDPLIRAVLMIPTRTATTAAAASRGQNGLEDFLALARQRGLYGKSN